MRKCGSGVRTVKVKLSVIYGIKTTFWLFGSENIVLNVWLHPSVSEQNKKKTKQRVFCYAPASIQHLLSRFFSDRPPWLFSYTIHTSLSCLEVSTNQSFCHVLSGCISDGNVGRCESICSVLPRAKMLMIKTHLAKNFGFHPVILIKINWTFQFLFQCDLYQSPFRQLRPLWKTKQNTRLYKYVGHGQMVNPRCNLTTGYKQHIYMITSDIRWKSFSYFLYSTSPWLYVYIHLYLVMQKLFLFTAKLCHSEVLKFHYPSILGS